MTEITANNKELEERTPSRHGMIVVTRPAAQARKTSVAIENLGFRTFCEPLLEITYDPAFPTMSRGEPNYAGLVFTSIHAVRAFQAGGETASATAHYYYHLPVYCVGEETAQAAKNSGYRTIAHCAARAVDLCAWLKANAPAPDGILLYPRGRDTAFALAENLAAANVRVEEITVYRAEPVPQFSADFRNNLEAGLFQAITFYSRRTAKNFSRLMAVENSCNALRHIKALCLGKSMLECVQPLPWAGTFVCDRPERQAMLDLIARTCKI